MQSLHYNNGSIKLTRERSTMVSRWEAHEVARWIAGLAGIPPETSDLFLKHHIDGTALTLLLREDLLRMGIAKLDQQLILMQSIDLLLTLVDRLNSETLALLFMRIFCAATACYNLLKRTDDKEVLKDNSNVIKSPEFYASISHLSDTIVVACHWLGRLPFIENAEYIDLRRKIIKVLVQIRFLLRNLRLVDQINMPKAKLILEINDLRTTTITLVRQNKDSLFSSDRYLIRVHLRRPIKDDVNIEYTTLPDFTHVISSIETEAMGFLGSGFNAINIGDEIIEINNQVVIGWDPVHFKELLRASSNPNEICLLVKKMPRHKDDEVYTKGLADGPYNPRRSRARGVLERKQQQVQNNRTRLLEQEGIEEEEQVYSLSRSVEIDIESDDEALYQSKRSSLKKVDQHSSLPDLSEAIPPGNPAYADSEKLHPTEATSASSVSTNVSDLPRSPSTPDPKQTYFERLTSTTGNSSSPNTTPKSPRRAGLEGYFYTFFRPRQDSKSIIPDLHDSTHKDRPQLVKVKRINSIHKNDSANPSASSSPDDRLPAPASPTKVPSLNKSSSQSSLQMTSSTLSSFSSLFKSFDSTEKSRAKRGQPEHGKNAIYGSESKMETSSSLSQRSTILTDKPPLNHSDSRETFYSTERRRRPKRTPSERRISCKDLGKGDCEGFLYRYSARSTLSFAPWKLYWCVLKGGTLFVFKSKEDKNREIEIKLEGKNISPAPEKRKYAFRIVDEINTSREYFYCATRDEMAKWMNKMGLAAINFNIDDSKIAGFHKGFVDSREGSPASMPRMIISSPSTGQSLRHAQISSAGDSENDSDKESSVSWQQSISQYSSTSDIDLFKEKSVIDPEKRPSGSSTSRHVRSASSTSVLSLPETNTDLVKSTGTGILGPVTRLSGKGHYRTSSSPIRFLPAYEDQRENAYVHAAATLSDSDSSIDAPHQRSFVNSQLLSDARPDEIRRSPNNYPALMLNSSGGFSTPTAPRSSSSSDRTASFSPSPVISSSQRPSNNSVFLVDDEPPSRSEHRPKFFGEEPFSPSSAMTTSKRLKSNSSLSSSSPPQHSPGPLRSAPLYMSVNTFTPSIPRGTSSLSPSHIPKAADDHESFFAEKKLDPTMDTIKHLITSSMQLPPSVSVDPEDESSSISSIF